MWNSVVPPSFKQKVVCVLNLSSTAEPQPNRVLGSGNALGLAGRSHCSSPPPSPPQASASRPSASQKAIFKRKLENFMSSILQKEIPCWQPTSDTNCLLTTLDSSESSLYPQINPIPGLSEKIKTYIEHDNLNDSPTDHLDTVRMSSSFSEHTWTPGLTSSSTICQQHKYYQFDSHEEEMEPPREEEDEFEIFQDASYLANLPLEVLENIIGFVTVDRDLLALASTCKDMKRIIMTESRWKPRLAHAAAQCDIGASLVDKNNNNIPSYLRYFAVTRWRDCYLRLKDLIQDGKIAPQDGPSIMEQIQTEWFKMRPEISPWNAKNQVTEAVEVALPENVWVEEFSNEAIIVRIKLDSGAHFHELLRQGLPPVLEFVVFDPNGHHPSVTCKTQHIYHPLLNSQGHLTLPDRPISTQRIGTNASATAISELIHQIKDMFTSFSSIASHFTL